MPEFPEVETIKKGLTKYLVGRTIEGVKIGIPKLFAGVPKDVIGAKIKDVERHGKGLIINLSNGNSLAIHIKLTGQLVYDGPDVPKTVQRSKVRIGTLPNKFSHVIFTLDKGSTLYYNDPRRFGWIKVVKTTEVGNLPFFKGLGPEFNDLTIEKFAKILSSSKIAIKQLLMDQKRISGIGNIYANDSLYDSKIAPDKAANSLSSTEQKALFNSIKKVFGEGLKYGGSSELNYVNALGEDGSYQDHTLIYGKQGTKCKRDGSTIKKTYLGGRGTYFCPTCQK